MFACCHSCCVLGSAHFRGEIADATRVEWGRRHPSGPRTLTAALATVLVLGVVLGLAFAPGAAADGVATAPAATATSATPAHSTAQLRRMSDAQLQALAAGYDGDAQRAGLELLNADTERDSVARQRDTAREQLSVWVADAYKSGASDGSVTVQVLAGGLAHAADSLRLLHAIGSHQASIIRALDDAEARLDITELRRAQLIRIETAAQGQLERVYAEQDRRTTLRADVADKRRRAASIKAAEQADVARTEAAASAAALGSGGLVAFGGFGSMSAASVSPQMLDTYLASKGSPMAGQGIAFVQSGMRWQVDPRLLVAISGAESNFGATTCGPNNAWGWACPNDPADFATWAAGIDTVTRGLREYYLDEGRTSVALIQQKYCPVGAANDPGGLNSNWLGNVTRNLLELGGSPANVGPGPAPGITVPDIGGLGMLGD
jgi:hypothetical protein